MLRTVPLADPRLHARRITVGVVLRFQPFDEDMMQSWLQEVPVLDRFTDMVDRARYAPVPDDWCIGISDVLDSTQAVAAGNYKAVNFAGAGTICAVTNALGGDLPLFAFGGDGAHFAVPPDRAAAAAETLSRLAGWADRDLGLTLRVGMITVAEARAAGHDIQVAFWRASDHVRYAMFTGGGVEWAAERLKAGAIGVPPVADARDPDLTGLSCQWGTVPARNGSILSLIVKPAEAGAASGFADVAARVIEVLEETGSRSPLRRDGPAVRWPSHAIALQSHATPGRGHRWRRLRTIAAAAVAWLVFRLGLPLGGFDPKRYRREIAANTDYRKFDDGLMLTVDCTPDTIERLESILQRAEAEGIVRYGMHVQDEAYLTCVAPSVTSSDHMHFIDGAGGGYTAAARRLEA